MGLHTVWGPYCSDTVTVGSPLRGIHRWLQSLYTYRCCLISGHSPMCAQSVRSSALSADSTRIEGLFPPQHHPQTTTSKTKGSDPTEELAGVVYQVPCASCPAFYVGQTGWYLGKWMKEHRKAVESGDRTNSALTEHTWSHHHLVDWDKVRVLEHQPCLYHQFTLGLTLTLNRNDGTLSPVHNSLFSC